MKWLLFGVEVMVLSAIVGCSVAIGALQLIR
jgi:hypothetical protein